MTAKVLLYSVEKTLHKKIKELCLTQDIECKKIPSGRFFETIGCHAEVIGADQKERPANGHKRGEALPFPMMVFSGIGDRALDRFLAEYKKRGLEIINHKAIITGHNMGWNAWELFDELDREHRYLEEK